MNELYLYIKELNNKGIDLKLINSSSKKNEWKYQIFCTKSISEAEELDNLFKEFYQFVGDLILDGYDVEIIENFNFLIRNPD